MAMGFRLKRPHVQLNRKRRAMPCAWLLLLTYVYGQDVDESCILQSYAAQRSVEPQQLDSLVGDLPSLRELNTTVNQSKVSPLHGVTEGFGDLKAFFEHRPEYLVMVKAVLFSWFLASIFGLVLIYLGKASFYPPVKYMPHKGSRDYYEHVSGGVWGYWDSLHPQTKAKMGLLGHEKVSSEVLSDSNWGQSDWLD